MTPDFECGMLVGGVGMFFATIILVIGWKVLVRDGGRNRD